MQDKEFMIKNMRNEDGSINMKNFTLTAACESMEFFKSMISINNYLSDELFRFIESLNRYLRNGDYETINSICQTMYGMFNSSDKMEGLSLVCSDDKEICQLYCQIFIGMLDLNSTLFLNKPIGDQNVEKLKSGTVPFFSETKRII